MIEEIVPKQAITIKFSYSATFAAGVPINTENTLTEIIIPPNTLGWLSSFADLTLEPNDVLTYVKINGRRMPVSPLTERNTPNVTKEDDIIYIGQTLKGNDKVELVQRIQSSPLADVKGMASITLWYIEWTLLERFKEDPNLNPFYRMYVDLFRR